MGSEVVAADVYNQTKIGTEHHQTCAVAELGLLAEGLMRNHQMKVGVWFYGLGTALTGILDIAWGAFDASHQPIKYLGKNLPGQPILAYVAGVWLVAAGLAILWRSARIGAMASAIAYLMFAALWLLGYLATVHALGWRIDVLAGIAFFLAGTAICSGIMDVPAARLFALMLLLFEGFVEIPPIFIRLHNQVTWGAAVYNLSAVGACLIFAEFLASRADRRRIGPAENLTVPRPDSVIA